MNYDWTTLLNKFEKQFLTDERILHDYFHDTEIPSNLIKSPATNEAIIELEKKISLELPPSYKEFLKVSDGFKVINQLFGNLFPVKLVQPLKNFDSDFVDIWTKYDFEVTDEMYFNYDESQRTEWVRSDYLKDCIAISDWFDGAIILLNPNIKFGAELEAWAFANWYPGAARYKSFWDLMNAEFDSYLRLRDCK